MRRYEVNDDQWDKIYCRLKKRDAPLKISAIPLVMCTGTSWRDIPIRFINVLLIGRIWGFL